MVKDDSLVHTSFNVNFNISEKSTISHFSGEILNTSRSGMGQTKWHVIFVLKTKVSYNVWVQFGATEQIILLSSYRIK